MNQFQADAALRGFLIFASLVVWLGIWLTGFGAVHWILYVPATFFLLAGITGYCPGHIISSMIFKKKPQGDTQ